MQTADEGALDSLDPSELKALKVNEVTSWAGAEKMRERLNLPGGSGGGGRFSRAKLCQRATISESTFTKGLKNNTAPSRRKLNHLRLALEGRRHELLAGIEGREDFSHAAVGRSAPVPGTPAMGGAHSDDGEGQ